MNYEQFLKYVINNLHEYLPDYTDLEISEQHLNKAQGESYTGISIRPANSIAGAVVNIERFYEMCEHENRSMDSVMRLIAGKVEEALNSIPDFDLSLFSDYERIRERLIPQVISSKDNMEFLERYPHTDIEDISVIYRVIIHYDENGGSSAVISKDVMKSLGIDLNTLHHDAFQNAAEKYPLHIMSLKEVMEQLSGEVFPGDGDCRLYIATNTMGNCGASAMFYPEFFKNTAEFLKSSYYILPSSLKEVLVIPEKGCPDSQYLISMVKEINTEVLEQGLKLTDSVYFYDAEKEVFSRISEEV